MPDEVEQTLRDARALRQLKAHRGFPALERLVALKIEQHKESLIAPEAQGIKISRKEARAAIASLRDLMASIDTQAELAEAAREAETEDREVFAASRTGRGDLAV